MSQPHDNQPRSQASSTPVNGIADAARARDMVLSMAFYPYDQRHVPPRAEIERDLSDLRVFFQLVVNNEPSARNRTSAGEPHQLRAQLVNVLKTANKRLFSMQRFYGPLKGDTSNIALHMDVPLAIDSNHDAALPPEDMIAELKSLKAFVSKLINPYYAEYRSAHAQTPPIISRWRIMLEDRVLPQIDAAIAREEELSYTIEHSLPKDSEVAQVPAMGPRRADWLARIANSPAAQPGHGKS